MTTPLISKELLSSVRDQLLQSSTKSEAETMSPPLPPSSPPPPLDTMSSQTDPLLDELLGDIRRSCGTSLASTPTLASSDGDKSDTVFECRARRSRAELSTLDVSKLQGLTNALSHEADCVSALLVKLLRSKDRHHHRRLKQCTRLSLILKDFSLQNGLSSELTFSLMPPASRDDQHSPLWVLVTSQWLNAWKVLSRLPNGIPKFWRRMLWSHLAARGTADLDWPSILAVAFSEFAMPGDEALGSQIVKDLHRTGNTGFSTEQEHAVLKRVLLAYARYNSATGYCQGFNVLTALILKVVGFDEHLALKVLVFLVDRVLPENYFAQNLYALSADMAVFRDYLKAFLPELSSHLESLQRSSSGLIKKAYSSDSPPDLQSIHAYEPPLADVFTMQWFLTMYTTSLPRKAVRRVWDLVLLEGSEALIHTAVAILAVMESELLQSSTAADFYSIMAQFGERLRRAQLLPSSEFMEIVYSIQDSAKSADSTFPSIAQLREKYTYNICPWSDEEGEADPVISRVCPPPTCGGALSLQEVKRSSDVTLTQTEETLQCELAATLTNFQKDYSRYMQNKEALTKQVRLLTKHYQTTAQQPQSVYCAIGLVPPQARIVCPQAKKAVITPVHGTVLSYGADVPQEALERSHFLSGYQCLSELQEFKKRVFTINYSQPLVDRLFSMSDARHTSNKSRRDITREEERVIQFTTGQTVP